MHGCDKSLELKLINKKMEASKEVQMMDVQSNHSTDEYISDSDETWDEIDPECEMIMCLFCPRVFKTMAVALEHCKVEHHFNLIDMKNKFKMDCYSYICMINYIRKENASAESLLNVTTAPWSDEKYLTPVYQGDPWLMFDFEGLESPVESGRTSPEKQFFMDAINMSNVQIENGLVTLPENSFAQLQQGFKYWMDQAQRKDYMIAGMIDQMTEMKSVAAKIVCSDASEEKEIENKIMKLRLSEDSGYFRSYSHFGIHHDMLSDEVRTSSYRDAIIMNTSTFTNKIVLDVGCGSGILSMFAANANAEKVIGVDQSEIIYHATDIIRENNLTSKIDLIHGKMEQISLPVEKVDIIISEWLGYFLLFEGMLDSVLYARDKYLKPDGLILPNRCCLFIAGLSDQAYYQKMVGFWSNVYGYKMSCLAKEVLREALVCEVPPESVATSSALVFDLNLYTQGINDTDFTSNFTLESHVDGELTALCGYFNVLFNLPHEVSFSTSPDSPKTHWKQTIFFLPEPIAVQKGTVLNGKINCCRRPEDNRALEITIQIMNQKNVYVLV